MRCYTEPMLGLKHFQKRKQGSDNGFPTSASVKKAAADLLVYPAAIIAPLALVPQVLTLYVSQNAQGLALFTWVVLALVNIVWIYYGRVHNERPIVLTNAASLVLNFTIALGVLLYK
jgi:uncharacterized protein with PQ loop repeat